MKVILVEDDNFLLDITKSFLEGSGFEVFDFEDSSDAMSFIKNSFETKVALNACLFDYLLPGLTGYDLYQEVRGKNTALPIFIISGHDVEEILPNINQDKNLYIMPKPFSQVELIKVLKSTLED